MLKKKDGALLTKDYAQAVRVVPQGPPLVTGEGERQLGQKTETDGRGQENMHKEAND